MQGEDKKNLEKEIVKLTELVIEATIQICEDENNQDAERENAIKLVCSLASKLSLYLGGQDAYIEEFLQQLIQQKLPDERILKNLPNFTRCLREVIENGITKFRLLSTKNEINQDLQESNPITNSESITATETKETLEEVKEVTAEPEMHMINEHKKNHLEDGIELLLRKAFPDLTLVKNYKLHGTKLKYYFPELKLALEKEEEQNNFHASKVWKEYYCTKAGIKLLYLRQEELINLRTLNKFIKKYAIN